MCALTGSQQEALQEFPDIEGIDLASRYLHSYTREKLSLEVCATILSEDSTLHEKLREAHRSQDSEALDSICVYVTQNAWRFHPHLRKMNELIHKISSNGQMAPIIRGEWKRPFWISKHEASAKTTDHIESLHIPLGSLNEEIPLIILHQLGNFKHDILLRKRLDRIFSPSNHTFLVNTSGTGKTKLLFEGLCLHWGFYLTCAVDTFFLGAGDLPSVVNEISWDSSWTPRLPSSSSANYTSSLQTNLRLTYRAISEVLLARLILFKMYLEICSKEGFCLEQRQRWLESQIFPRDISTTFDSFGMLKSAIADARLNDKDLDEAIMHCLDEIQNIWEVSIDDFFYIVLDEANVASRKHEEAFEDQYGHYPILKEIIRSLRQRMGHLPVRFVVSGTIIPEEHFQSSVGEWDDFRWCSDTGSFDDPEEHRRYVSKFMPTEFASSVTGQTLLDRMWQWLRGRHRYTASFLAVLLHNSFRSPHTLLGHYIERITEYIPHDNHEYSGEEEARYNGWYAPLGSRGLGLWSLSTVTVEMHRAATSFLSTSNGCIDCLKEDRILITEDYGYFIDPDCAQIGLNEPLTITSGASWLKKNSYFGFAKFIRIFCKRSEVAVHPTHFAHFLTFWLASLLRPPCKISDAFRIIGLPATFSPVKLVTCTKIAQQIEAVDVHIRVEIYGKLVFMANSAEDIVSWFKHERDEPFCALLSSSSNTVILAFCLQLADERSFWVFVRISSKSTNEEDIDFAQEIDDLHPTKVFHDQPDVLPLLSDLPNLCLEVGELGVLRISGSSWAERATEDKIPAEQRPAGVLNIDGLDMAEKGVPHSEFMRRLSLAIVQTKKKVEAAPPLTVEEHSKKGKKRGRSSTVVDEAGAVTPTIIGTGKTKSTRFTKGIAVDRRAAGDHRTKSVKSTKVDVATGPDTKPGNDHKGTGRTVRSGRRQHRIETQSDRVEATGASSSTPYNLRKR
ncbi:uncharacterized protein C8R40DRAFT_1178380 [Lentinula edodes]|uniref:uncharacterized protein n=1 Tax=Lentinula edodes TaxID=5353 RepID=UPI001E8DEC16|nr:uncharacterized protein C8R40DRAFT_1178380 [Lentinula edodes]KAH7867958.1 hypothetical protein C8R40DRAFT_1178380 [Lentinula edodes]